MFTSFSLLADCFNIHAVLFIILFILKTFGIHWNYSTCIILDGAISMLIMIVWHLKNHSLGNWSLLPDEESKALYITVNATDDLASMVSRKIQAFCQKHSVSKKLSILLALATEEMVCVQISNKEDVGGSMDIIVRIGQNELLLIMRDKGRPFDIVAYAGYEQAPGSSIDVLKKIAAEISYTRAMQMNNTIIKFLKERYIMINELCLKAIVECKRLKSKALSEKHGGTAYPGEAALKIYPNVIKDIAGDMPVIFITGTNGKTTTARMIGNVFDANNIRFIANREGANKPGGIAACFILRTGENGMLSGSEKIAIIEADEISIPAVIGQLNVFCALVTNLYDDQPYRLPKHSEVARIIIKSLAEHPEITCIFNENENGCKIIADKISNEKIYFNDNVNIRLHYLPDIIYRADAAAALSLLKFLNERHGFDIDLDDAKRIISETKPVFARNSSIKFGNINLKTELIKNSSNLDKVVDWLECECKKPDLIIASDDRRELIWMKNYDWKRLEKLAGKVYLWGEQDEIKFLSEQLEASKFNDFYEIENFLLNTENETILLFDYYACLQIWEFFAERGYVEDWWKN